MKIGIIGCGFIGTTIAKAIDSEINASLVAVSDADEGKANELIGKLSEKPKIMNVDELVSASDLVIEAATPKIVQEVMKKVIENKKNVMIMSIGGLIKDLSILEEAKKAGVKVYLPSGAIGSLDALKSASEKNIESVILTTTKPPKGLAGAPYVVEKNVNLDELTKKTIIFEGNVHEAIKGFPKNVNVSAILAIAGIGPEKTKVRVVCDPNSEKNIHEIEVSGDFGKYNFKIENVPSPENPKTSYLAALSVVRCLKNIFENVKVGN